MTDVESEPNPNNANAQEDLPPAATATADPVTTSLPQQTGGWNAAYDCTSQKWYYYNLVTHERRWEPPPDWIPNDGETAPVSGNHLENKDGYFYTDMHGIDQGPFSVQQLYTWRGALPMDLPVWKMNEEENKEKIINDSRVAAASTTTAKQHFTLAEVLGDDTLLTQWREIHPEIVETTCAAPFATDFERDQQNQQQERQQNAAASTKTNDNNKRIDFSTSLAEAVIAGLPPDDEAVQLSRVAASAGQSLHEVVDWSRKQSAALEGYTVAAVHTAGRGRIQAVHNGQRESLYADMGSWIDPTKLEEQMKKASSSSGGKRKMTPVEVKAAKLRKQEMKEKKQRAWLQD